jgi:RimJ/RimL family protein N-acetyltransferase
MGAFPTTRFPCRGGEISIASAVEAEAAVMLEFRKRGAATSPYISKAAGEVPDDVGEQAARIRRFNEWPTEVLLVARTQGEDRRAVPAAQDGIVGLLGLTSTGRRKLQHVVELGMMIDVDWRGRGVGRAIMGAALTWARGNPTIEKVSLAVIPPNTAAMSLYESFGFEVEGVQKRHMRQDGGEYLDSVWMAVWVK